MEEPPKTTAEGVAKESAPALVGSKAKPRKPQDAGPWELKWQHLQSAPEPLIELHQPPILAKTNPKLPVRSIPLSTSWKSACFTAVTMSSSLTLPWR